MASVFERNGSLYIRFKDERGRWQALRCAVKTKREARRLAEEKEILCERVRLGVEKGTILANEPTVRELLDWWLEKVCKGKPSYEKARSAISRHLLDAPFADRPPNQISPGEVEEFFDEKTRVSGPKRKPLGPQAVNHLRGFLGRTLKSAIKKKKITGPSLIDEVKVWRVPKRKPDFLRSHEVGPVLRSVPSKWRLLFTTAIYTGLRKGELFGLRKADLDFDIGMIFVRRSYDRDTTKGGHEEGIPMASELVSYLLEAVDQSPSELVFPRSDGSMYPNTTQLETVLRRALRRAGIILGYRHKCRKSGCGYFEASVDQAVRRCPKDRHLMWVTSVVRPIRFHDLRHTTGSLLTMQGANLAAVQRIMRHKDPRITSETYLHLDPGYLRREIDRLNFGMTYVPPRESSQRLVAIVSPAPVRGGSEGDRLGADPLALGPLTTERDTGLEPATFSLGKARTRVQPLTAIRNRWKVLTQRMATEFAQPTL
jgi:integrase